MSRRSGTEQPPKWLRAPFQFRFPQLPLRPAQGARRAGRPGFGLPHTRSRAWGAIPRVLTSGGTWGGTANPVGQLLAPVPRVKQPRHSRVAAGTGSWSAQEVRLLLPRLGNTCHLQLHPQRTPRDHGCHPPPRQTAFPGPVHARRERRAQRAQGDKAPKRGRRAGIQGGQYRKPRVEAFILRVSPYGFPAPTGPLGSQGTVPPHSGGPRGCVRWRPGQTHADPEGGGARTPLPRRCRRCRRAPMTRASPGRLRRGQGEARRPSSLRAKRGRHVWCGQSTSAAGPAGLGSPVPLPGRSRFPGWEAPPLPLCPRGASPAAPGAVAWALLPVRLVAFPLSGLGPARAPCSSPQCRCPLSGPSVPLCPQA